MRELFKTRAIGDVGRLGAAFSRNEATRFAENFQSLSQQTSVSARQKRWDVRTTPLGIDGGNLLPMSDGQGGVMALVGRNTLLVNWMMKRNAGGFSDSAVNGVIASANYDAALVQDFLNASREPLSEEAAIRMAAEMEITKEQIASALNLPKNKVVFIEQAGFHIDMETRPIGPNKVMVSDLKLSLQAIDALIKELKASQVQLLKQAGIQNTVALGNEDSKSAIDEEIALLEDLRDKTQRTLDQGAQILLDRKALTLQKAGITVVRAAANFGGIGTTKKLVQRVDDVDDIVWRRSDPTDVNFANGIAATDRQGKTYFITNKSRFRSTQSAF